MMRNCTHKISPCIDSVRSKHLNAELKINLPEITDPYPHKEPCSAPINLPL